MTDHQIDTILTALQALDGKVGELSTKLDIHLTRWEVREATCPHLSDITKLVRDLDGVAGIQRDERRIRLERDAATDERKRWAWRETAARTGQLVAAIVAALVLAKWFGI